MSRNPARKGRSRWAWGISRLCLATQWKTYPNGRAALYLVDAQTRETVAVATADLPEAPLKSGEVFIKDHSENRGMLAALEQAGVVKATGAAVRSGFAEIPVAALLPGHDRQAGGRSQQPEDPPGTGREPNRSRSARTNGGINANGRKKER